MVEQKIPWSPEAEAALKRQRELEARYAPKKPETDSQPKPSARRPPHGAIKNYHVLGAQSLKPVFRGMMNRPQGKQGLIIIGLMIFGAIIGIFTGLYVAGNFVNPPVQVVGVCQAPAHFVAEGGVFGVGTSQVCVISQVETIGTTATTINIPAGQYYLLNGTRYTPP